MSNLYRFLAVIILAVIMLAKISAVQAQSPRGITISPAFQQVSLAAGQAQQPITFTLTNNESTPRTLDFSTHDFNTLDETGGLFFVGSNPTELQKKYGLATWLSLPQTTVTIAPKQTIKLNGEIINVPSMPAGGHYGALLVQLAGQVPALSNKNSVGIHPIASSLLFVTKLGGDTHLLKLSNVYVNRHLLAFPGSITLRFKNDGNTHLIPRGVVAVTNSGGKLISRGIVNENSGIILPASYRQYGVQLVNIAKSLIPGRYKLTVNFRFDGINQFRAYQTSFWVVSAAGIGIILLVIILAVVVIYSLAKKRRRARAVQPSRHKPAPKKIDIKVE